MILVINQWIRYSHEKVSVYNRMVVQFLMALEKGRFTCKKDLVGAIISQFKLWNPNFVEADADTLNREVCISVDKAERHGIITVGKTRGSRLFECEEKLFIIEIGVQVLYLCM